MRPLLSILTIFSLSYGSNIDNYIKELELKAKKVDKNFKEFSSKRGKEIFFKELVGKRGKKISCASCHTSNLSKMGENIFTGKKIEPLSPKANPKRLSDLKKVKKWLRRNFKDVYKRDGTAQEKGDVLKFILEN